MAVLLALGLHAGGGVSSTAFAKAEADADAVFGLAPAPTFDVALFVELSILQLFRTSRFLVLLCRISFGTAVMRLVAVWRLKSAFTRCSPDISLFGTRFLKCR
jgi:hypothetical protein